MIEKFDLRSIDIPYGVLHDQRLISVKEENNKLIFTFEIEINSNDYTNDFYNSYQEYNRCDMIVDMVEEPFNCFYFSSCPNSSGKYKGLSLNTQDFINCINDSDSVFICCSTNGFKFYVELFMNFYNSKKYKKLKKYNVCNIEIDCNKSVLWKWYCE